MAKKGRTRQKRRVGEMERVVSMLREWEGLRALEDPSPAEAQRARSLHARLSLWCRQNPVAPQALAAELDLGRSADEIAADLSGLP